MGKKTTMGVVLTPAPLVYSPGLHRNKGFHCGPHVKERLLVLKSDSHSPSPAGGLWYLTDFFEPFLLPGGVSCLVFGLLR